MNEERLKLTDEDILDLAREYGKEDQEKVKLTVKEMIQANEKELEEDLARQRDRSQDLEL